MLTLPHCYTNLFDISNIENITVHKSKKESRKNKKVKSSRGNLTNTIDPAYLSRYILLLYILRGFIAKNVCVLLFSNAFPYTSLGWQTQVTHIFGTNHEYLSVGEHFHVDSENRCRHLIGGPRSIRYNFPRREKNRTIAFIRSRVATCGMFE